MSANPIRSHLGRGLITWLAIAALAQTAVAQGTQADYDRANRLRQTTAKKVFRDRIEPHWFDEGRQFWYRVSIAADRHEFVRVDAEKGTRGQAFDHQQLATALTEAKGRETRADCLPIERLEFSLDGNHIDLRIDGKWWRYQTKEQTVVERPHGHTADGGGGAVAQLVPVGKGPTASRRTGEETNIIFLNRTAGEVEVVWLNPQGHRRSYGRLPSGGERTQHTFSGHVWLILDGQSRPLGVVEAGDDRATVELSARSPGVETERPREGRPRGNTSPDGQWTAFRRDHNVWIRGTASDEEFALTDTGTVDDAFRDRFFWSPDSTKLVALQCKKAPTRQVHFIESSPRDQVQPKLHSHDYAKPGDVLSVDRPLLFDVAARRGIPVSDDVFANPWSIDDIRWAADSGRFTFVYNQRGHQALRLLAVDAGSGSVRTIIDETSETFINYSGKYFLHHAEPTDELLWMSERDGWNHLYLYDARSGAVKSQITKGSWVVRQVDRVDEQARQVWFRAGGIHPGQDPYHVHYCRVNFDGSGLVLLTEGDGTHSIELSPDGRFFLDTYSRVDLPPVVELRRSEDGMLLCELERADWRELLKTGWQAPQRFAAKGRDGETDILGVIFRPTRFDPTQKYPVIEEIYAGPQGAFVPKAFSSFHGAQAMAELGFIVVKIDGMGTSHRSKKFHDVCWRNLADSGFPDRILWMRAAAAKEPAMDLSRVGIYGGSAGGQSAACAVMRHGDFYKVAVADCGCHDNRMDKIWWNEQWMGWPVDEHYAANSNVTLAAGLAGKLLLIVGEMDTNVDPASTMQVVDALIKADKDFDLLVIPGVGHGAAGTPYGVRRQRDYFVRHLLGVEPRR
jgi:dipeptidyl aminopeptidase/acylaminoacyl peptidase